MENNKKILKALITLIGMATYIKDDNLCEYLARVVEHKLCFRATKEAYTRFEHICYSIYQELVPVIAEAKIDRKIGPDSSITLNDYSYIKIILEPYALNMKPVELIIEPKAWSLADWDIDFMNIKDTYTCKKNDTLLSSPTKHMTVV